MGIKDKSQFLVIRLADKLYAINLEHAVEIINPRKAGCIPETPAGFPKEIEYEKGRIPIIDLWRHLQNKEHAALTDTIMVITECAGEKAALVVDSADEILRIDNDELKNIAQAAGDSADGLIEARLDADDRNIPVINLSGIYKLSGVII